MLVLIGRGAKKKYSPAEKKSKFNGTFSWHLPIQNLVESHYYNHYEKWALVINYHSLIGGFHLYLFPFDFPCNYIANYSNFRNQFTISSKYFDMVWYLKSEAYSGPISFEVQRNKIWTDNIQSLRCHSSSTALGTRTGNWKPFGEMQMKPPSIITNLETCSLQTNQSESYKSTYQFWLNLSYSHGKKFSHLQINIFCHFNFCHNRRNGFWSHGFGWKRCIFLLYTMDPQPFEGILYTVNIYRYKTTKVNGRSYSVYW